MSTKKIGLALTIILPTLLIGCGGGSDDSSSGTSTDSNTQYDNLNNGTRLFAVDYDLDESVAGDDNLRISYFEIFNKKINNTGENTALGEYVLTSGKLYSPQDITNTSVILNSLTSWTSNYIGDIKTDIKLEKVNISGKNIFDTVLPGYRSLGFDSSNRYSEAKKLLSVAGNATFPEGSTCYRFVSRKVNQEFFNFSTDDAFNQDFYDFDKENTGYVNYLNEIYKPLGLNYRYVSGTWQNIPWTTIYDTNLGNADDDTVAVKFQNNTYLAEYNSNIEWTPSKEIKQWQNFLDQPLAVEKQRIPKLNIEKLKNGCDIYNAPAAGTLASYRIIDWNN